MGRVAVAFVGGCGGSDASPGSALDESQRLIMCGGFGLAFPPAALTAPLTPSNDPNVVLEGFAAARSPGPSINADPSQRPPLRLLVRQGGRAQVVAETPGGEEIWLFERSGGAWKGVSSSGSCSFKIAWVPGQGAASLWALDSNVVAPSPEDRSIRVLVDERNCASGASASDRVREPFIVYTPDAVQIGLTVKPRAGFQTRPGVPPSPYTVKLREPLGNRQLLDYGREPIGPPRLEGL